MTAHLSYYVLATNAGGACVYVHNLSCKGILLPPLLDVELSKIFVSVPNVHWKDYRFDA